MIGKVLTTLKLRFGATPFVGSSEPDAGEKTILIIDESLSNIDAMRRVLAGEGYRVECAVTAEAAIQELALTSPDLILLDCGIPYTYETRLATRLFAEQRLLHIPIVALTEGSYQESGSQFDGHIRRQCDAAGWSGEIRGFLEAARKCCAKQEDLAVQAIPMGDCKDRNKMLLDEMEAGLPGSQFATGTRESLRHLSGAMEDLPDYEVAGYLQQAEKLLGTRTARARSRFRSLIRLCQELIYRAPDVTPALKELRRRYLENRLADGPKLQDALRAGDFAVLELAGNNLKGTGGSYGFAELTEIGGALAAAASQENAASIEVLLDRIESYVHIVRRSGNNGEAGRPALVS